MPGVVVINRTGLRRVGSEGLTISFIMTYGHSGRLTTSHDRISHCSSKLGRQSARWVQKMGTESPLLRSQNDGKPPFYWVIAPSRRGHQFPLPESAISFQKWLFSNVFCAILTVPMRTADATPYHRFDGISDGSLPAARSEIPLRLPQPSPGRIVRRCDQGGQGPRQGVETHRQRWTLPAGNARRRTLV